MNHPTWRFETILYTLYLRDMCFPIQTSLPSVKALRSLVLETQMSFRGDQQISIEVPSTCTTGALWGSVECGQLQPRGGDSWTDSLGVSAAVVFWWPVMWVFRSEIEGRPLNSSKHEKANIWKQPSKFVQWFILKETVMYIQSQSGFVDSTRRVKLHVLIVATYYIETYSCMSDWLIEFLRTICKIVKTLPPWPPDLSCCHPWGGRSRS